MMFIEDQTVYLTRGDDAVLGIALSTEEGTAWQMGEEDVLTLTLRKLPSEDSEIQATISTAPGSQVLIIRHEDTRNLEVGEYSADVELITAEGKRFTVWPRLEGRARTRVRNYRNFVVMSEVTIS